MPLEGFETTIPASERQQTHALDRAATGIGPIRQLPAAFPTMHEPPWREATHRRKVINCIRGALGSKLGRDTDCPDPSPHM
jgi:hypothetical protein